MVRANYLGLVSIDEERKSGKERIKGELASFQTFELALQRL
jgi:hypothetical protein